MTGFTPGAAQRVWDHLTELEREVHRRAGYFRPFGPGNSPALLVIDMEYNFTGLAGQETLESVDMYPNSCTEAAWEAIPAIAGLIEAARDLDVPVVYTHGTPADDTWETPRRGTEIVDELAPETGELVIAKSAASAFFNTGLAERLRELNVDTVMHVGCTTSGCVRASVVDGAAHGFRNVVVEEAVFDRARSPHEANLFDMETKYADVLPISDALAYMRAQKGEQNT